MSAMDDPIGTETSEHNIILIFSGDKSVLYPISLLLFRNYIVFLVVPDDDAGTQSFQANKVFNWCRDVLGYPQPTAISIPETFKSPGNGWVINGSHVPQLSLDSPSVGVSPSNVISPRSENSVHISSPKPTTFITPPASTPRSKDKSMHSSEPFTRAPSVLSLNFDPRTTSKSLVNFGTITSERYENINASAQEFSKTQPQFSDTTSQISGPELNKYSNGWIQDDWSTSGWDEGSGSGIAGSNWLPDTAPAPQIGITSKEKYQQVKPPKQENNPPAQRKPQSQGRNSGSTRENNVLARENEIKRPSTRDPSISVFDPLVKILRGSEKESMMRSQLGEHLAKCKGLYQSASVSGFGEFIALAAKNNVIIIRGSDNHQQVKLKNSKK